MRVASKLPLVVNEEEAERVKAIFALLEVHRSVLATLAEIERRGWRLKSWTRKNGQFRAGGEFERSSLHRLLTNVIYKGAVRHKGQVYPGEHAAIIPAETWERVQHLVVVGGTIARGRARNKHLALLSGLLCCESCKTPMVYSYSKKKDRKYPYYVCLNAQRKGWAVCPGKSLPAGAIEESVLGRIREARPGGCDLREWEQLDRKGQVEALQSSVGRIGYNGVTRQITIRFHADPITAEGKEAQA